jgi:hypothetical protein
VIDRHIQEALAVDPSPEFLARVRQRIADEPSPRTAFGFPAWTAAAVGAVALAAAVFGVSVVRQHSRMVPGGEHPTILASQRLPPYAPAVVAPASSPRHATIPPAIRTYVAAVPSAPEVLISASESRAIQNLIAGVREGRIDPRSLPADPPPASDIIIPPIAIAPISASSIGEGVRQ